FRAREARLGRATRPRKRLSGFSGRYTLTCVPGACRIAFVAVLRAAGDAYRATEPHAQCASSERGRERLGRPRGTAVSSGVRPLDALARCAVRPPLTERARWVPHHPLLLHLRFAKAQEQRKCPALPPLSPSPATCRRGRVNRREWAPVARGPPPYPPPSSRRASALYTSSRSTSIAGKNFRPRFFRVFSRFSPPSPSSHTYTYII
ncbi:uncharacterized protein SCHCODRAFT_02521137, partial [Schizophyllum commune H4-8]|uniref:uncharacterized protein n=1 Tax=Schizophyllum commune (strain H4-8 / FGSC 9210) TaxID=578458 RepID=UPI00215F407B